MTPPGGSGAIGVIRVAGPHAERIVTRLCRTRTSTPFTPPLSGQVRLARVVRGDETLDEAVVSRVPTTTPAAFDLCLHGGIRIMERVSEAVNELGAPCSAAAPIDAFSDDDNVVGREALTLMPGALTGAALEMLAWQRVHLPEALRRLERLSATDWPLARIELQAMRSRCDSARRLIEGCGIALIGPVNSGKSSLFNRMVGREAALVSSRPGTTLDWITETVDLGGIAVTLYDTAGVNPTPGVGERRAIDAGRERLDSCRLTWHVVDASDSGRTKPAGPESTLADSRRGSILILNKADLLQRHELELTRCAERNSQRPCVACSALTGEGLAELKAATLKSLGFDNDVLRVPSLFTERQRRVADAMLSFDSVDGSHARSMNLSLLWKSFDEVENPGL